MHEFIIAAAFMLMVLSPCFVAMNAAKSSAQ
jgi:hypothetical protein